MALIIPFNGKTPTVHPSAFVAPTAVLIGDVTIGAESSIWFGAVLRGDDPNNGIVVGPRSSVQDNCVIHVGRWQPTVIGADVTVGHGAKFECCTIGDRTVVGMNAVILQHAVIGAECVLAANTVVLEGADIPDRSLVAGGESSRSSSRVQRRSGSKEAARTTWTCRANTARWASAPRRTHEP